MLSAQCLIKMVSHAKRGGAIEIMGLLQGKIRGDAFFLTDCFQLPVEGTETRVNAGESANEFMVQFIELNEKTRFSKEMVCGWYHSHPGYGCWLSGIDVATQSLYQSHQDPFVALVIDPVKTSLTGKVELGAFRTLPENTPGGESYRVGHSRSLPREKVEDFGMHCDRYYNLEVEIYKSIGDEAVIRMLWKEHWANLLANMTRMKDLRGIEEIEDAIAKAKSSKNSGVGALSDAIHKCACSRVNALANQMLFRFLFTGPTTEMDTEGSSS